MQFPNSYKKLESLQEEYRFQADSKVEDTIRWAIFEVECVPLHCMRASSNFPNGSRVKKLFHTSVANIACHFWRSDLPWGEMSSTVDCNTAGGIPPVTQVDE